MCSVTNKTIYCITDLSETLKITSNYSKIYIVNNLNIWADKCYMNIDVKKCYPLRVRQKSSNFYTMDGHLHVLKQVEATLTFSDVMKMNIHINQVRKKTFIIHHKRVGKCLLGNSSIINGIRLSDLGSLY